jgi:hypothetical protein
MDTSERLREVANLRYALQSKSRLRLEFLGELSKLLRVHGQPVRDEVLASLVLAIPDELPGEGFASKYNGETLYAESTPPDSPPETGIPPKTPPRPPTTAIPPKTPPSPVPEPESPQPARPPKAGSARETGIPPKTPTTAQFRENDVRLAGKTQTLEANRKKRTSGDTSLSGDTARGANNTRHMG